MNRHARVIAVEAFAPNLRFLRANAAQFPNVMPVEAAIGVTSGSRTFRVSPITGGGYVEEDDPDRPPTPGIRDRTGEGFVLETVDLAGLCERESIGPIDLMKMDLEGLEEALLSGQLTNFPVLVKMKEPESKGEREEEDAFKALEQAHRESQRTRS